MQTQTHHNIQHKEVFLVVRWKYQYFLSSYIDNLGSCDVFKGLISI